MWKASPPMPGSFWARWKSRMWTTSRACPRPFPSTRRPPRKNPRSTVGTVTEIYDYLRLLYARIGMPALPQVRQGDPAADRGPDGGSGDDACRRARGFRCWRRWCAAERASTSKVLEDARKSGYVRVRVDGNAYDLGRRDHPGEKQKAHHRDRGGPAGDAAEEMRTPSDRFHGNGHAALRRAGHDRCGRRARRSLFSQNYACPDCGISIEELTPRMFSFNNPYRRLPQLHRPGHADEGGPGSDHSQTSSLPEHHGGRHARHAAGTHAKDGTIASMYFEALAEQYQLLPGHPGRRSCSDEAMDVAALRHRAAEKLKLAV